MPASWLAAVVDEVDDAGLARAVRHPARARADAGDARGRDDRAATGRDHHPRRRLDGEEHADQVDAQDGLPLGDGQVEQARQPAADPGVGEGEVEPARRHRGGDGAVDIGLLADVAGQRGDPVVPGGGVVDRFAAVEGDHRPAARRVELRRRPADAAARAGDQRDPSGEIAHAVTPRETRARTR